MWSSEGRMSGRSSCEAPTWSCECVARCLGDRQQHHGAHSPLSPAACAAVAAHGHAAAPVERALACLAGLAGALLGAWCSAPAASLVHAWCEWGPSQSRRCGETSRQCACSLHGVSINANRAPQWAENAIMQPCKPRTLPQSLAGPNAPSRRRGVPRAPGEG